MQDLEGKRTRRKEEFSYLGKKIRIHNYDISNATSTVAISTVNYNE